MTSPNREVMEVLVFNFLTGIAFDECLPDPCPAIAYEFTDGVFLARENRFYGPVRQVPNPSFYTEITSPQEGLHPEVHSLDSSAEDGMNGRLHVSIMPGG